MSSAGRRAPWTPILSGRDLAKLAALKSGNTRIGEFTMADTLTISPHLPAPQIRSYMTRAAVDDLSGPDVSPPEAADGSGRSAHAARAVGRRTEGLVRSPGPRP